LGESSPSTGDGFQLVGEAEQHVAANDRQFAAQQEQLAAARQQLSALAEELHKKGSLIRQQRQEIDELQARLNCRLDKEGMCGVQLAASQHYALQQRAGDVNSSSTAEEDSMQALRLKYLKSKSALESLAASNTRLLRELEVAKMQASQAAAHDRQRSRCPAQAEQTQSCAAESEGRLVHAMTQQLATANHRAERLQIELDAATAKLAVYQQQDVIRQARNPPAQEQQQQQQQQGGHTSAFVADPLIDHLQAAHAWQARQHLSEPAHACTCHRQQDYALHQG
jgi:hypothetical protein